MKKVLSMFVVLLMSTMMWGANSSVPENAPDVMLQAFYWDSYPSNSSNLGYGNTGWSALLNQADELGEYFDLVWLPPCSQSSGGTGYIPKQYSNLNSDWGSETQLRELISKLKAKNTRCVADIVVNHITGNYGWCSFATMDFGDYGKFYPEASWICQTDEMNYEASAGSCQGKATGANDDGYGDEANYTAARDWDHKNSQVQAMCRAYLKWLKNDVGFDGWRYDYGKGFHHSHINDYNSAAGAYMSVVEYWDGNPGVIRSRLEDAQWNNMAFDFGTKYDAINNGICSFNYGKCKGAGMLGAGLSKHAVTFVDNHDTFQRNNSEFGGQGNSMLSNFKDRLLQANAYILSMPGIPCVFYPHWVTYKSEIKAMIEARHLVGVHSQSEVKDEYAEEGGYQVTVVGSKGYLILQLGNKVGGSFDGFTKKASGNGYAMWIMTNTPVEHTYTVAGNSADVFGTAWAPSFEANDMIKQDDGSYKWEKSDLVLKAGTIELKVCEDHGWDVSYPAENYQLKIDAAGTYTITITFNAETKAISATATKTADADPGDEPGDDPQPAEKDSIFLVNAKTWATPTVHLWGGTAAGTTWPGVAMTKVNEKINGYDVYKYVADKGAYKSCIFNNAGADQTADLDWTSGKYYYIDKWYAKEDIPASEDPGTGDDPQPAEKDSIFLVNAKAWATPTVHLWGGTAAGTTWPGVAMTKVNEKINGYDVYKYVADKGAYKNCIFNNAGADQTADLDWTSGKYYYIDKWYAKEDIPASEDPGSGDDPQPATAKFYITGDSALVVDAGLEKAQAWNPAAIKSETDTFELSLKADQYYVLKVTLNGTWEGENNVKGYNELTEKADGLVDDGSDHNIGFKLSEAGKVQVIYTTDKDNKTIFKLVGKFVTEGSGSGDDPQPAAAKFYITGDSALVVDAGLEKAQAWNPAAIKSEKDTFELDLKADQYYVLKVTLNGTWEGENNVKGYNELTEKTEGLDDVSNDHNIGFKLSEAGKVQVIYTTDKDNKTIFKLAGKFVTEGSGSGDDPQPGAAKFYVTGDTALVVAAGADKMKAWKADAIKSEKDTLELSLPKGLYHLKVVVDGSWEGGKVKGFTALTEPVTDGLSADADDNIVFTLDEAGKVQVIYFVKDSKETFQIDGKFHVETHAKFYITGDSALVVDAGLEKAKAWNADAIKSEKDTFELDLKADQYYVLKVTLNGTWEGENNVKGYNELTEKADGLVDDSNDHNIGFKLSEAGKVQVIYTIDKDNKTIFKLAGKFVTEGSGSGDDPQPGTKYFMKNNWNGGEWSWKEMTAAENNTFKLEKVVFGGMGVNYNTAESDEGAEWVAIDALDGDEIGALDTVTFVLDLAAEKKVKAILLGKYNEGQGGGDDPQPATAKFYITGDSALVVDAGLDKAKAWNPAAIKSEKDTFELDLKADQYYVLKVTLNGTWEGENNVKGYNELTEKAEGLVDDGNDHNIGFKLSEAGKVQVIYTIDKDNKTVFKLVGKFVTEGSGSGDDPQPGTKYFMKNNWNGGEWSWKEMTAAENNTFKLEKVVFGGTGVNYNTAESDEGAEWVAVDAFAGDEIGALDTVTFVLDLAAEKKVKAILLGKYNEGQGGGDDPQPATAKFYITGDSALVVDAGLEKAKAWKPDAIKSEVDTFELDLKADQYYVLKVTLNGTWEGENNVKGYNELTEKTEGLVDDGNDHNIGFKLSEAGKVQVIYTTDKENKTVFKLVGKFVTEGSGSGDDPQPGTKYFMKNNWNGGAEWSWKEMTAAENNTFKLEKVVFGGTGVNYNTAESDEGAEWVAVDAFAGDEIGALDTVTFVLDLAAEKKVKAILLGKYNEGQGGGDDPQPGTKYFMKNNWNGGAEWSWKEMTASENNTFKLEKVVFGGTGVNYNTAESDEGAEWVAIDALDGDEIGALDTVTFVLDLAAEKKVKAILLGKYNEGQGGGDDPQPGENVTVYFVNNVNWEAVNAYVWVGEGDAYKQWPGEALTKETAQAGVAKREAEQHQGYDIYSYTFPSKYVNIIFNNGSVQTVDLTWNAAKPYFYPDGAEGSKVKGTWYAKEEIPSGGEPIVKPEDGYYLLGTFNSWTPAAEYLFKANPDKANEYYLSVTLAVDDKLKVAKVEDGAAKTWYPDGMDNDYVVDAAHAGAKVIYFQTTYNAEWEAFGGYFYIASDTGTGVDNIQSGATYQKFIENGQLFILRDGRIYTPAGQFVR